LSGTICLYYHKQLKEGIDMGRILKYDKAKLAIIDEITRSHLRVGDCLPSERTLAAMLPYSSITLRRSLKELEEAGVITKVHGKGSFLSKDIDSSQIIGDVGVLRIIRNDRPHSSTGMLFNLNKYLRSRGVGVRYVEADEFNKDLIDQFHDCMGLILMDWITEKWIDSLRIFNMPLLVVGSNPRPDLLPTVGYDWREAARILTAHFIDTGHKKIGLINGELDYLPSQAILSGYKTALSEAGMEFNPDIAIFTHFNSIHEETIAYLRKNNRCDALLVENMFDFLQAAWVANVTLKPRLGWINSSRASHLHVPASVVVFPDSLFENAARRLLDHILHQKPLTPVNLKPYFATGERKSFNRLQAAHDTACFRNIN
jgi:DNA-binding LacI/PurR family transcriptional regulator